MAQTPSSAVVNQALMLQGDNSAPVTGSWPSFNETNPAGKAANILYGPCVQTVMRQFEWDFTRNTVALVLSGNVAPTPWSLEYKWPDNAIQIWQILPPSEDDPNDPLPINFVVANATVDASQQRVIQTNLADALVVFDNYPSEGTWDADFRETVVRLLASELAMALSAKPEITQGLIQSSAAFEQVGEGRQD